ncbi:hypothetical protein K432DRAFT_400063 [Lepidopterella palustris CBS 459.81]|uniref:Uncharacterized protein n=1 Tax=Lepidopterella palustris CBS 459.81 TaxID=1314670 RepID=A0A8E2JKD3_9PEZI|nr:hypothetical protein K432DRAFT_400063 [Lepidopterella palustris CBS 459.81]
MAKRTVSRRITDVVPSITSKALRLSPSTSASHPGQRFRFHKLCLQQHQRHASIPRPAHALTQAPLEAGITNVTYTLAPDGITTGLRANDTVSIQYDALVFALSIPSTNTSLLPKSLSSNPEFPASYAPHRVIRLPAHYHNRVGYHHRSRLAHPAYPG